MTAEVMSLAQGHPHVAELLTRLKPVSAIRHFNAIVIWETLLMEMLEWIFLLQLESEMDG